MLDGNDLLAGALFVDSMNDSSLIPDMIILEVLFVYMQSLFTYVSFTCLMLNVHCTCNQLKDGAYYCYCAYVLRIARYSGFLWVVPTNTGIFLRGLILCGESRT